MMTTVDPYASGVLVREHHERIVADIENYAKDAGIQPRFIWTPLPDSLGADVRDYVKGFKRHVANADVSGLVFHGPNPGGQVEQQMSALAGCLVRNFIRARVMTLGSVLDLLPNQEMPDLTCLLIPNFFVASQDAGSIAKWQVSALYDYLTQRFVMGQQTIIYASDLQLMGKEYGLAFLRMVETNFIKIKL